MLFIYSFFDIIEAMQTQKHSFCLHVWKCNGVKTGVLSSCQNINKGLSFHSIMGWPKASISRAGRSVHGAFALTVFIRLSSSPPAPSFTSFEGNRKAHFSLEQPDCILNALEIHSQ